MHAARHVHTIHSSNRCTILLVAARCVYHTAVNVGMDRLVSSLSILPDNLVSLLCLVPPCYSKHSYFCGAGRVGGPDTLDGRTKEGSGRRIRRLWLRKNGRVGLAWSQGNMLNNSIWREQRNNTAIPWKMQCVDCLLCRVDWR